jgi:hypothetical protein
LRITNAIPTEAPRVYASSEEIIVWYENLNKMLGKIQSQFVFKVYEVGFSEWVGSKEVQVLVPSNYISSMIRFPMERGSKRRSACFCISTDDRAPNPM